MRDGRETKAGEHAARRRGMLAPCLGLLLGLVVLALPAAVGVWNDARAAGQISAAEDSYRPYDNPEVGKVLAQARKWNRSTAGKSVKGKVWGWDRQLEYGGNASNCWVEIPAVNVKLPVYKGTSQETLAAGAGILEGGSLPVGGKPSNCVLTAHSGMPNERMFDGIRNLEPGDKVCVHTLGRPYAYEVRDVEVVWPSETDHLRIYEQGTDMLTLLTCSPYGVNDHRLLVHCTRIEYDPADFGQGGTPASAYVDNRTVPLAAALAAAGAAGLALAARKRKRAAAGGAARDGEDER